MSFKTIEFSTVEDFQVNWQDGVSKTNVLDTKIKYLETLDLRDIIYAAYG